VTRVAIIPARGGSKRLPRKNLLPFLGRPIIVHTIEAALATRAFERVIVSTEDPEIAAISTKAGADIHKRDANLASDAARITDVCLVVLDSEEKAGRSHDLFACLYATAPLRNKEDILAVLAPVDSRETDFAMAVTTYAVAPHQALRVEPDGSLSAMWPDLIERRAAEVGPLLVDNGSTYAARVAAFREHRTFYGPRLRGHVMPRARSVDIDEQIDYELACFHAGRSRT
jgi:pseudaminic acid cytidylyltransferase